MDFVAFRFTVTGDSEGRVSAQSSYGGKDNQGTHSCPSQQVLPATVVNETKFLGVEVKETEDHSETNATIVLI